MFKVDFDKVGSMLTPTFLRRPGMLAWIRCLITPVHSLYSRYKEAREYDLFRESIDSTVPRLEFMLNLIFYPDGLDTDYEGRIRIQTMYNKSFIALFLGGITQEADERRPVYLVDGGDVYLYSKEEILSDGADFMIRIPATAQPYDLNRLLSLIRSFALPDKRYVIIND